VDTAVVVIKSTKVELNLESKRCTGLQVCDRSTEGAEPCRAGRRERLLLTRELLTVLLAGNRCARLKWFVKTTLPWAPPCDRNSHTVCSSTDRETVLQACCEMSFKDTAGRVREPMPSGSTRDLFPRTDAEVFE